MHELTRVRSKPQNDIHKLMPRVHMHVDFRANNVMNI